MFKIYPLATFSLCISALAFEVSAQVAPLVEPPLALVGQAGNPGDDQADGKGAVAYDFQIGQYETTVAEYTAFLNAVARADTHGLYNTQMTLSPRGGIQRAGAPGSFVYEVKPGYERRPVNFVTRDNALRFCNWLHNGAQLNGNTESGAYDMSGTKQRLAGARYFLPNADEWHKAAYYEPFPANRPSASFWRFAVRSDSALPEQINFENHYGGSTDVYFPNFPSFFGTVGQNGNVHEILENSPGLFAGGSYQSFLQGGWRFEGGVLERLFDVDVGFRIAASVGVASGDLLPLPPPPVTQEPLLKPLLTRVGLPFNLGDDFGSDDDLGETDETSNRGAVPYEFQIGTYEVTNEEYTVFLNAVARTDLYRLYNTAMGQPLISDETRELQGGILRTGNNGSFSYAVRPGFARKPVNFLDPYSAMRFCNWLHNGAQPGGDTEYGAYAISGRIWQGEIGSGGSGDGAVNLYPARSVSARYYIPTLHEWHKAAYYDPAPAGKPSASYWSFAVRSDLLDLWPENYDSRFDGLVDVDRFKRRSFFGTVAQGGNIAELTITRKKEADNPASLRVSYLGGHWETAKDDSQDLSSRAKLPDGLGDDPRFWGLRLAAPLSTESALLPPKGTTPQRLSFKMPKKKRLGNVAFKIRAKTTSKRNVYFDTSDPSVAIVSQGTRFNYVLLRGPGTVTITAFEEGDQNWAPVEVSRTLKVLPRKTRTQVQP